MSQRLELQDIINDIYALKEKLLFILISEEESAMLS